MDWSMLAPVGNPFDPRGLIRLAIEIGLFGMVFSLGYFWTRLNKVWRFVAWLVVVLLFFNVLMLAHIFYYSQTREWMEPRLEQPEIPN
jgi:hypothetical protein